MIYPHEALESQICVYVALSGVKQYLKHIKTTPEYVGLKHVKTTPEYVGCRN